MVAIVGSPNKQDMDVKVPIFHKETLPKKDPVPHQVFAIKLPLDIDISIHREYNRGFVLSLLALVLLFLLPFLFLYSFHRQMLLYEFELAELRMTVSEMSLISSTMTATSEEIQNSISQVESLVEQCNCNGAKDKGVRRKRNTDEGQDMSMRNNALINNNGDDPSNHTMRGAVRAAHFKGLLPEKVVEAGQIGPWYEDQQATGDFKLQSCKLRDRGVKLIVNETGLYLIYAQVYYLTSKSLNSYSINVSPGNKATSAPIAYCSANAASAVNEQGASEVSCYTSVVRSLQAGDAISLQQQERQRRLLMRDGHSFIGLVRLS